MINHPPGAARDRSDEGWWEKCWLHPNNHILSSAFLGLAKKSNWCRCDIESWHNSCDQTLTQCQNPVTWACAAVPELMSLTFPSPLHLHQEQIGCWQCERLFGRNFSSVWTGCGCTWILESLGLKEWKLLVSGRNSEAGTRLGLDGFAFGFNLGLTLTPALKWLKLHW